MQGPEIGELASCQLAPVLLVPFFAPCFNFFEKIVAPQPASRIFFRRNLLLHQLHHQECSAPRISFRPLPAPHFGETVAPSPNAITQLCNYAHASAASDLRGEAAVRQPRQDRGDPRAGQVAQWRLAGLSPARTSEKSKCKGHVCSVVCIRVWLIPRAFHKRREAFLPPKDCFRAALGPEGRPKAILGLRTGLKFKIWKNIFLPFWAERRRSKAAGNHFISRSQPAFAKAWPLFGHLFRWIFH